MSDRTIRRYRRALEYRPHHQTIKKSLTLVQEKSKMFFSQRYLKSNIKKWLFCDEKLFTMQNTGTVVWAKAGAPRPRRYIDNIIAHVQLWDVVW